MPALNRIVWLLIPFLLWVQVSLAPMGLPPIINSHESVESVAEVAVLQNVMERVGMVQAVLHAIPESFLYFKGDLVDLSEVKSNNAELKKVWEEYPDKFSYFCSVDPMDPQRLTVFDECLRAGAVGVKLYNGYTYSHEIPVDDARLGELYTAMQEQTVPLMLPVNTGEYEGELRNLLTLYPDLTVICPHYCLSSKSLDRLTALMEDFPSLYVDTSFGHVDFVKSGFETLSENAEDFARFFETFQDRVLFGTENVLTSYEGKSIEWLTALYQDYIDMLRSEEFDSRIFPETTFTGLNLPYKIQYKVFYQNWMNLTH